MAVITIRLAGQRPVEAKRRLAVGLTDVITEVLGVPREEVIILVEELERGNWAIGGVLQSDRATGDALRHNVEAFFKSPSTPVKAQPKKSPAKSPRRR